MGDAGWRPLSYEEKQKEKQRQEEREDKKQSVNNYIETQGEVVKSEEIPANSQVKPRKNINYRKPVDYDFEFDETDDFE